MERKNLFYSEMAQLGVPVKVLDVMKKYESDKDLSVALLSICMSGAEVYSCDEIKKDVYGAVSNEFGRLILKVGKNERFIINCKQYTILDVDNISSNDSTSTKKKKMSLAEIIDNAENRVISANSINKKTYSFYRFIAKVTAKSPNEYMPIFVDTLKERGVAEEEIKKVYFAAVAEEINYKILREEEKRNIKQVEQPKKKPRKKISVFEEDLKSADENEIEYQKLQEEIKKFSREKTK